MSQPNISKHGGKIMMVALVVLALACSLPTSSTPPAPAFDSTKAVLELQGTTMALQLTQQAIAGLSEEPPTQAVPPSPEPTNRGLVINLKRP